MKLVGVEVGYDPYRIQKQRRTAVSLFSVSMFFLSN